jgi:hypothetical protein
MRLGSVYQRGKGHGNRCSCDPTPADDYRDVIEPGLNGKPIFRRDLTFFDLFELEGMTDEIAGFAVSRSGCATRSRRRYGRRSRPASATAT